MGVKSEDCSMEVSRPGQDDLIADAVGSDSKQRQMEEMGETQEVLNTSKPYGRPSQSESTTEPEHVKKDQTGKDTSCQLQLQMPAWKA